jgi:hypothetical protein
VVCVPTHSIAGLGTNEKLLNEIMATRDGAEMEKIKVGQFSLFFLQFKFVAIHNWKRASELTDLILFYFILFYFMQLFCDCLGWLANWLRWHTCRCSTRVWKKTSKVTQVASMKHFWSLS